MSQHSGIHAPRMYATRCVHVYHSDSSKHPQVTVNDWPKSRVGAYKEKPSVCIMHIYTLTAGSLNMGAYMEMDAYSDTQYKLDSGVDDTHFARTATQEKLGTK